MRVSGDDNVADALHCIEAQQFVIEDVVDFKLECSVIGARNASGAMQFFGPVINDHSNHILDVSVTAHDVLDAQVCSESIDLTASVLESLDIIGVVCVEMFLSNDNRLVINEIAPRPHNSGHLTIEAAECSQFGQQLRAICGLPLSSMELRSPAAMANLLGDHLMDQTTPWSSILSQHDVNVHLYGKREPRKGREDGTHHGNWCNSRNSECSRSSSANSIVRLVRYSERMTNTQMPLIVAYIETATSGRHTLRMPE